MSSETILLESSSAEGALRPRPGFVAFEKHSEYFTSNVIVIAGEDGLTTYDLTTYDLTTYDLTTYDLTTYILTTYHSTTCGITLYDLQLAASRLNNLPTCQWHQDSGRSRHSLSASWPLPAKNEIMNDGFCF